MNLTANEVTFILWLVAALIAFIGGIGVWFVGRVNKSIDALNQLKTDIRELFTLTKSNCDDIHELRKKIFKV